MGDSLDIVLVRLFLSARRFSFSWHLCRLVGLLGRALFHQVADGGLDDDLVVDEHATHQEEEAEQVKPGEPLPSHTKRHNPDDDRAEGVHDLSVRLMKTEYVSKQRNK